MAGRSAWAWGCNVSVVEEALGLDRATRRPNEAIRSGKLLEADPFANGDVEEGPLSTTTRGTATGSTASWAATRTALTRRHEDRTIRPSDRTVRHRLAVLGLHDRMPQTCSRHLTPRRSAR